MRQTFLSVKVAINVTKGYNEITVNYHCCYLRFYFCYLFYIFAYTKKQLWIPSRFVSKFHFVDISIPNTFKIVFLHYNLVFRNLGTVEMRYFEKCTKSSLKRLNKETFVNSTSNGFYFNEKNILLPQQMFIMWNFHRFVLKNPWHRRKKLSSQSLMLLKDKNEIVFCCHLRFYLLCLFYIFDYTNN